MGKLYNFIAVFALFVILLLHPESCLAESPVPAAVSACRKCKRSSDNWRSAVGSLLGLPSRGRDSDHPRGTPSTPRSPPKQHP